MKTNFLKIVLKLIVEGFKLKQKTLYLQSTEEKKVYLLLVLLEDHDRNAPVWGQEQGRFYYFKVIQLHNHSFVHQNGNPINTAHEKVSLLHRMDLKTVLILGSSSWWSLGLLDKAIVPPSALVTCAVWSASAGMPRGRFWRFKCQEQKGIFKE